MHWRLASHTLANNRLLNDLLSGNWDGRDLDGKLAALDSEDQQHYVFCPLDPRLSLNKQGMLEPAERERTVTVPRQMKAKLDQLGPLLLAHWRETGTEPWTVRAITNALKQLGWQDGDMNNAWLYVRSWLLGWQQVVCVGQDYWIPADQVPQETKQTRLQVMPIRATDSAGNASAPVFPSIPNKQTGHAKADESQVMLSGEATATQATWSVRLRTVNLLEGFIHIPASARGAYPPPVPGEKEQVALRAVWFEDNTHFWLWLDRTRNQLYGPALADKLGWLYAGDIIRVEWAPDVIVLRIIGHDEQVSSEEARLVDIEALATLRGGLGESYRRSLQAILQEAPEGLHFAQIVRALRERQSHEVHRGTIHALLHHGGFLQKDHRWFAVPDSDASARQLRMAIIETLIPEELNGHPTSSHQERLHIRVKAIHSRLSEIVTDLRRVQ